MRVERLFVAGVLIALSAVACTLTVPKAKTFVKIGTGSQVGVYYSAGLALAELLNDGTAAHGIDAAVESTEGSVFNINALASGEIDFGFAQADRHFQAVNGEGLWQDQPIEKLRFICSLHSEALTLVAASASGIKSIQDLGGRIVSIGAPGSGTRETAVACLELFDLMADQDYQAEGFSAGEAAMMLQDGRIDAFFYAVGHPNGSLTEVTNGQRPVRFVPITGIRQLFENAPYYHRTSISMKYYPNASNSQDIETVGMRTALLATSDVSEETVYQLTKQLFEHLQWYQKRHPSFRALKHRDMTEGAFAPLHPGAERYFKEAGLLE